MRNLTDHFYYHIRFILGSKNRLNLNYGLQIKIISTLLLIILSSITSWGQNQLFEIAREGLKTFWDKIPPEKINEYGFDITDSINNVHIEEPLNLYQITPTAIENYNQGDSIKSLLSLTDLWYFPLSVDNIIKSILVVDKVGNEFKAVSLGYARLAKAIDALKFKWRSSTGYRFKLVVVYQAKSFLYTIPELNNSNLTFIDLMGNGMLKNTSDLSIQINKENLPLTIRILSSIIQNQGD